MATIGSYQGVDITAGTDAEVAAQVKTIDATKQGAPADVITSDTMTNEKPLTIPKTDTPTAGTGLSGFMESFIANQRKQIETQQAQQFELEKQQQSQKSSLADTMNELIGLPQEQLRMEQKAGIDAKSQKVTDYTNQLEAEQHALRRQVERIEKNKEGMFGGAVQQEVNRVERESLSKQADIALLQSAANRDLTTAQSIIDRKIALKTEPLKLKLQFDQFFYEENRDLLSKSEERTFNQMMAMDEKALQFAESEQTQIHSAYLLAAQNGAPDAVLKGILSAKTSGEALSAVGQYAVDPLDREAKRASIANMYSQIAERSKAVNENGTLNGKPQTAAQSLVAGYADRLAQSNIIIDDIGDNFTSPTAFGGMLPNVLQTGERQSYEQAKRNFVNAILRRESGAAISPSEFTSAEIQYFPRAGDAPEVVTQKQANRQLVINSLYKQANVPQPVLPGAIIEADGKRYKVGDDGESITEL
jgi:hypothetical protein